MWFTRNAIAFAFCFAILFSIIALAEHRFAVWQINNSEADDLRSTVTDVWYNLFPSGNLEIADYRQWQNDTPSEYFVISGSGEFVDAKGDATNLLHSILPIDRYLPRGVHDFQTDLGETWLIDNERVSNGNVLTGINAADQIGLDNPKHLLSKETAKYGSSLESASSINTTILRNFISASIVVDDLGAIKQNENGIPLRLDTIIPAQLFDGKIHDLDVRGEPYAILARRGSAAQNSMLVVAFDAIDMTPVDQSLRFNIVVGSASWVVALLGFTITTIIQGINRRKNEARLEISTRQLIAQGENAPVEFKSTLRWNLNTKTDDARMELAVLKSLAAFMNTDGGTLLIGVSDDRAIVGLAPDHFQNTDKLLLHFTNLVNEKISKVHMRFLRLRVESMDNGFEILRVDCKRAPSPAYVKTDKGPSFFVRTGPRTDALSVSEIYPYIRQHFPRS